MLDRTFGVNLRKTLQLGNCLLHDRLLAEVFLVILFQIHLHRALENRFCRWFSGLFLNPTVRSEWLGSDCLASLRRHFKMRIIKSASVDELWQRDSFLSLPLTGLQLGTFTGGCLCVDVNCLEAFLLVELAWLCDGTIEFLFEVLEFAVVFSLGIFLGSSKWCELVYVPVQAQLILGRCWNKRFYGDSRLWFENVQLVDGGRSKVRF